MSQLVISENEGGDLALQDEEKIKPWERQVGEPAVWYSRFRIYKELMYPRSVRAAFLQEQADSGVPSEKVLRSQPTHWNTIARRWRWKERAEAWDAYRAEFQARKREQERLEEQLHRAEIRNLSRDVITRFLEAADETNTNHFRDVSRIVEAALKVNEDSRKEYGDNITHSQQQVSVTIADLARMSNRGQLDIALDKTPAPMIESSQKALEAGVEPRAAEIVEGYFKSLDTSAEAPAIPKKSENLESENADFPPIAKKSENIQNIESQQLADSGKIPNIPESELPVETYTPEYLDE